MAPRTTELDNGSAFAINSKKADKAITLNKLVPASYRNWVFQTRSTFKFYNCWNIIDGTELAPEPPARGPSNQPEFESRLANYNAREVQAYNALVTALDVRDIPKIKNLTTAKAVWDRLADEFGKPDQIKFVESLHQIVRLSKDPSTSIDDHIRQFEALVDDFNFHSPDELPMPLGTMNLLFIGSLGDDWRDFHRTIRKEIPTMTSSELYSQVKSALLDLPTSVNDVKALKAHVTPKSSNGSGNREKSSLQDRISDHRYDPRGKGKRRGRGKGKRTGGNKNGNGGSSLLDGAPKPPKRDPNVTCTACGKVGHVYENCFHRLWLESHQAKRTGNADSNARGDARYLPSNDFTANVVRYTVNTITRVNPPVDPYTWIVDSGANAIITPYKERLQNYKAFNFVCEVDGFAGMPVTALGSGSLALQDHSGNRYTLPNVVYCPQSSDAILSMMALRHQGLEFQFHESPDLPYDDGHFSLTARKSDFNLWGHSLNDLLYVSEPPSILPTPPKFQVKATRRQNKRRRLNRDQQVNSSPPKPLPCDPNELWHLRLQHAAKSTLQKLKLIESKYDTSKCEACLLAKHKRTPYDSPIPRGSRVLERIHSDLAGPYVTSKGKSKYLMTFLDDYTHWTEVVTLPNKNSETLRTAIAQFIKRSERLHGQRIVYFHVDRGREYLGAVSQLFQTLGVRLETTAPYSPQSNGKAERLNRTLGEKVRAMLFHANMPESFWAEAMMMAAHSLNYLPSEGIDGQIPWELWHKKELTQDQLQSLKPFGCIVHIRVESPNRRSQFSPYSQRGCLVGILSTKVYRVWNFETSRFQESHHVDFDEVQFPTDKDFNEPPASKTITPPSDESEEMVLDAPLQPAQLEPPKPIYDEIVVEPLPETNDLTPIDPPKFNRRSRRLLSKIISKVLAVKANPLDSDPASFEEAMNRSDREYWIAAMKEEFKTLDSMNAWTLTDLPRGKHAIGCKWVYRIKKDGKDKLRNTKREL
jgi:transposase InsO family protein